MTVTKTIVEALSTLSEPGDVKNFLSDLCTPQEIKAMEERFTIVQLLNEKDYSYRDISHMTGASTTTVARVARFLNHEPHGGYRHVLEKLNTKDD